MDGITFNFFINVVAPLQKKNTHMRDCINVETCVAIFLSHLSSGKTLTTYEKLHRIPKTISSKINGEFCNTIQIHLLPLVIPKLTVARITHISIEYEKLHGIPYILG